jgi:hypothetical protein
MPVQLRRPVCNTEACAHILSVSHAEPTPSVTRTVADEQGRSVVGPHQQVALDLSSSAAGDHHSTLDVALGPGLEPALELRRPGGTRAAHVTLHNILKLAEVRGVDPGELVHGLRAPDGGSE